jgi:nucleotide-binding universal stress UspA family protein
VVTLKGGYMRTIVVGVDGSPGSQSAVEFAAREAAAHGATLRIVTAWEVPATVLSSGGVAPEIYRTFEDEARRIVSDAAARVSELEPSVPCEERVVEGHAGNALVDETQSADLVIIGRRGHGALTELLLGSISHQVVDHARCPVVIVPPIHTGGI